MTPEITNNADRANLVATAIEAFAAATGLDPALTADGPQTVAGDMICNILHWVSSKDPGTRAASLNAVRYGIAHYMSESYIDYSANWVDELGPEASIKIIASCNGDTWCSATGKHAAIVSSNPHPALYFDVIVTRNTTESCTVVIEAKSKAEAIAAAIARSHDDPDLVWEQDDTPNASSDHYVTNCEEVISQK